MNLLIDQIIFINQADFKAIARSISLIENEVDGYEDLLLTLKPSSAKIIGITGAPGAGKSSLADVLIVEMINDKKKLSTNGSNKIIKTFISSFVLN